MKGLCDKFFLPAIIYVAKVSIDRERQTPGSRRCKERSVDMNIRAITGSSRSEHALPTA
jgi:hypothetical protein